MTNQIDTTPVAANTPATPAKDQSAVQPNLAPKVEAVPAKADATPAKA
jgi:hypothetical protein